MKISKIDEVFQCIYQFYRLAWSSDAVHEQYKWNGSLLTLKQFRQSWSNSCAITM